MVGPFDPNVLGLLTFPKVPPCGEAFTIPVNGPLLTEVALVVHPHGERGEPTCASRE